MAPLSHDRIDFPITQAGAPVHNGRPLVDGNPVIDLAPPVVGAVTLAPPFPAAQVPVQVAASSFVAVNVLVDPLMADTDAGVCLEPQADLLRAPVPLDQLRDLGPTAAVETLGGLGHQPRFSQRLGALRIVSGWPGVAPEFTADGGWMPLKFPANEFQRVSCAP